MKNNKARRVVWQDIKPARPIQTKEVKKPILPQIIHIASTPVRIAKHPRVRKIIVRVNRKAQIVIALLILAIAASGVYYFSSNSQQATKQNKDNQNDSYTVTDLKKGTPDYSTVAPTGKDISVLGGWTRISPPNSDPVYAYADKIDKVSITVSEQPLPDNLKEDTADGIAQLARGFNANEKITIGDTIVYIGTSSDGPQSVIFTKNNLLIMMKSTNKIKNDLWANYISSMQ